MTSDKVKSVLRQPSKQMAICALDRVNLTLRERRVVECIFLDGLTVEQTAELMDVSSSAVAKWKRNAVEKCDIVFNM